MSTLTNSLNEKFEFRNNLVVVIDGTYFAKYQPDSGLVVDSDKLLVDSCSINPTQIDLRRATTQINSTTIKILDGTADDDFVFSAFMGADPNALIGKEVQIFFGRIDEAIPFSEYIEISKYIITDINKSSNFFNIVAKSQEDKTLKPAFTQQGTLDASINDSATSIAVEMDEDIFPATGIIKIGSEYIRYSSKVFAVGITTFTVSARGDLLSTASSHTAGAQVNFVQKLEGNPIDLILQLLISSGGGGVYDVLSDGAGIDSTLVDVATFENIRDTFFSTDIFTLYPSDLSKLIEYIETELLVPNNVRIIKNSMDNLISITILDQSDLTQDVEEVDDSVTLIDSPTWKISKNGLQTVVKVQWNWIEGLQKYTRSRTFKADQEVLDVFGEVSGKELKFKGVQEANNGASIASDRANRYLQRFSTPRATVALSAFMTTFKNNVGDKVRVTAKHLPAEGGGVGMSSILELVNRSVNTSTGVVKLGFVFTSYSNIRSGLISPSPFLNLTITSQKVFEVPDGSCYKSGFALRLWDYANKTYYPDAVNIIQSVDGNFITMQNDWSTILSPNAVLFFADYDESNSEQRARYAYTVGNTNFFNDGSKGYQIIL